MELSNLTFEQMRLIIVVYTASIIPLITIPYLTYKNKIPKWIFNLYVLMLTLYNVGFRWSERIIKCSTYGLHKPVGVIEV